MPPVQCVNRFLEKKFNFCLQMFSIYVTQTKQDRQCTYNVTLVHWRSFYTSSAFLRAWYHAPPLKMAQTTWPLKMGPISCPETSIRNYHSTPCKIPILFLSKRQLRLLSLSGLTFSESLVSFRPGTKFPSWTSTLACNFGWRLTF
jgi:hypothetical protein